MKKRKTTSSFVLFSSRSDGNSHSERDRCPPTRQRPDDGINLSRLWRRSDSPLEHIRTRTRCPLQRHVRRQSVSVSAARSRSAVAHPSSLYRRQRRRKRRTCVDSLCFRYIVLFCLQPMFRFLPV